MFFLPWQSDKKAALPSPKHQANATEIIVIGNTTVVAAFPKYPISLFPINICSSYFKQY